MPWGLTRFHHSGQSHFVTFCCYHRRRLFVPDASCRIFESALERVRRSYRLQVYGYVVMPEHVHLLLSEPRGGPLKPAFGLSGSEGGPLKLDFGLSGNIQPQPHTLSDALKSLKQGVSRRLIGDAEHFWQKRYYDFNIRNYPQFLEKLRYIHRNPVKRGLCDRPEDWPWSSFRHYATGTEGRVEIESEWTRTKTRTSGRNALSNCRTAPLKPRPGLSGPPTIQNLAGLPTITYGVDGEGRIKTVSASTGTNPVSNTVYNTASQITEVDFGSTDKDTFLYDSNTARMTQYKFFVGSSNVTGNLTWNANGTLETLAITDGLNSSDTQTCTYGYDDLTRLTSASCGSAWSQTFSFDLFGNISKSGSWSFAAGYLTAEGFTNNRIQSLPGVTPTYDSNGNLTSDGTHTSSWDAEGRPVQIDTTTMTYDALGRMVETGGGTKEIVYSPMGSKLALMTGQTLTKAFVPLPGGATVVYTASGIAYYRHADWLGSSRVASTPSRTKYYDVAYAPYGESYAGSGTTDLSFTGQNQDAVAGFFDFLFREYNPVHGRWISPDPAGVWAVDPSNPQSWNRYAYALNNPLALIDPLGLCIVDDVEYQDSEPICRSYGGPSGGPNGSGSIPIFGPVYGTYWNDGWHQYLVGYEVIGFINFGGPGQWGWSPVPFDFGGLDCKPGSGGCKAANNGQPQKQAPTRQQKCAAAKANLAAIDKQGSAMAKMNLKELGAGAVIGCGVGVIGGEAIESPLIGTPAAPGNCAVGAIGGTLTAEGVFVLANFGDIVSQTTSEAKAVAQVIQNCF